MMDDTGAEPKKRGRWQRDIFSRPLDVDQVASLNDGP